AEGNRTERMGREDPPRAASSGTLVDIRHVRSRAIPPEVRRNELEAARPFRHGTHQEAPGNREGDGPVGPPSVPAQRRTRPPRERMCITGNAVRMLLRFGYTKDPHLKPAIDWLVRHQKKDGGWHCFRSATGTLDCWEALAAFAVLPLDSRSPEVLRSIERGAKFYLDRLLFREGQKPYAPWFRLHYPVHYYYDILVGLDVLTSLGFGNDPRMRPALDRLEKMRNRDGTWNLDAHHPD